MKKKFGVVLCLILVVTAGVTIYFGNSGEAIPVQAASYFGTDVVLPDFPETGTKGSETNPFVVLEIVPYEGYAEIGYMIGGCEPISLELAAFDNTAGGLLASTMGLTYEWKAEYTTTLPEGDIVGYGPGQWQYNAGSGQYSRYRNSFTSKHSFLKYAIGLSEAEITNYKIHVITITPDKLNIPANHRLIERADLIYLTPKSHYGSSLITLWEKYHPDKAILNEPENFYSNDLTWETAVRILEKATISIDPAPIIFDVTTFSTDLSYLGNIEPEKYYSSGILVSGISATGYTSNAAKLYLAMQQMEPGKFYRDYIATGRIIAVPVKDSSGNPLVKNGVAMTTGYLKDLSGGIPASHYTQGSAEDAAVWNIHTLLPYHLFADYAALNGNLAFETLGFKLFPYDGDATHRSIRHGLYAYNGDNSITQIFLNSNIIENQYNPEAFDYYMEERAGSRPASLTPAEAIYFLLNAVTAYTKSQLHILEIEPCRDFVWDGTQAYWDTLKTSAQDGNNGSDYARQYYSNLLPHYMGSIKVTTMTSSEFIGRIEDLNSTYDLVYIGLRDGMLRKNGSGVTIYNDSTLNGRVYLHVGDRVTAGVELRGALGPGDISDEYRFAGNDITTVKKEALEEYMNSGFPIVLGEGFYHGDGTINSTKIDSASQIYLLAQASTSCLFSADFLNRNELEKKLTEPKCLLVFGKLDGTLSEESCYPVLYKDKTKDNTLTDQDIYINGVTESFRTLQYKFYIRDDCDDIRTYRVNLFLDINADGQYETLTERIDNIQVRDGDGYEVNADNLKAGVNYIVTSNLEESCYGVIPWKLQITDTSNPGYHYSVTKISALKVPSAEKLHINVLQVIADSGNNIKLAEHALFKKYTEDLNDYILHFKTITVSEFENYCGSGDYTYYLEDSTELRNNVANGIGVYEWDDYDGDRFLDVDMLILGFADIYTDVDNENALKNMEQYIGQGKTVLFTHDTTSFFNVPRSSYTGPRTYWGYHLNKKFRNAFGMDRFGVTAFGTPEERLSAGKDYPSDGYIQGYSDTNLNRFALSGQYFSNMNFPDSRSITGEYVTKVNHGQLTLYPYEIDNNFKIATTHSQYYQLDMESDDIVVWYCLSDNSVDSYGRANGLYSSTPNDVRNNYYIYSKGNITYSGVGHSAISQNLTDAGAVMETKLFINTIIAAYSSTAKEPVVTITNPNKSVDSSGREYIYVDYDLYATEQSYGKELIGACQKVKYQVTDNNLLYNKKLTVKYFDVDPVTGIWTELVLNTKKAETSETVAELTGGADYYIEIPLGELDYNNKGRMTIIRVTLTYGLSSEYSIVTDKAFTLLRRELFDLE